MSFGDDEIKRECPVCGRTLTKPYWKHMQAEHPEEYNAKSTWKQLYADYKSMGMDKDICMMVIGELFNASQKEVEAYLKNEGIL